jgi:hypothetical protein
MTDSKRKDEAHELEPFTVHPLHGAVASTNPPAPVTSLPEAATTNDEWVGPPSAQPFYVCTLCFHTMNTWQIHDQGKSDCPKCHKGPMLSVAALSIPSPAIGTPLLCLVCAYVKPWGIFDVSTGVAVCIECRDKAQAARSSDRERIAELEHELDNWRTWGVVEVAVRNPQVAEYCEHWEGRVESAESHAVELQRESELARVVILNESAAGREFGSNESLAHWVHEFGLGREAEGRRAAESRVEELQREVAEIDNVLARRPALADTKTRSEAVSLACHTAGKERDARIAAESKLTELTALLRRADTFIVAHLKRIAALWPFVCEPNTEKDKGLARAAELAEDSLKSWDAIRSHLNSQAGGQVDEGKSNGE